MEESRGAAEFSHIPRLDRRGASRATVSLRPIFQADMGLGPKSRFPSRKVSEEGERGCLAAPSLRGSEFVWSALGKFWGKQERRGGCGNLKMDLGGKVEKEKRERP